MQQKTIVSAVFLTIGLIILGIYGFFYGEHSSKPLSDTLTIDFDSVTKIELSNLTGDYRSTEDKEDIQFILNYLNQVQYKRLMNDQTAYMPKRASIIYVYEDDRSNFIVPYENEAMINYKVYKVKNGAIDQAVLLKIFESLHEN